MGDKHTSMLKPAIDPALEMSDSDLFLQEHGKKIIWGLVGLVMAILLVGAWFFYKGHQRSAAEALFSTATGPDGWNAVVDQFPFTIPAGNARLMLAASKRDAGDLQGAISELDTFLAEHPNHPMAGTALLTLAEIHRLNGDTGSALETYRLASSKFRPSFAAPLALLGEAELLAQQGKEGEAKAVLESVGISYPNTPAAMIAARTLAQRQDAPIPATP